jgi:hypothetical protein
MSNRLARLAWIAPTALAGTLLVTAPAQAAGVDPATATAAQKAEAMTHFNAGKKAVDAQNWEKATLELRASLDLVDSIKDRLARRTAVKEDLGEENLDELVELAQRHAAHATLTPAE